MAGIAISLALGQGAVVVSALGPGGMEGIRGGRLAHQVAALHYVRAVHRGSGGDLGGAVVRPAIGCRGARFAVA
jgi:hypothetical protein